VGLIAGSLVALYHLNRRLLWLPIALVACAFLFVPSVGDRVSDLGETYQTGRGDPNSLAWRVGYWQRVLPLASTNPVTGIGLDMVQRSTPDQLQPHNGFVQSFTEAGVFGLGALLVLIATAAADLRRAAMRATPGLARGLAVGALAGATSVFLQLFTENLLTQAAMLWYFAAVIAPATAISAGVLSRARRHVS
jgi:O-antigen ligase